MDKVMKMNVSCVMSATRWDCGVVDRVKHGTVKMVWTL